MYFDYYSSNLTRLDDFLEVQVAGLASAGRRSSGGHGSSQKLLVGAPRRGPYGVAWQGRPGAERGFSLELERFCPGIEHLEVLFEFFSGEHIPKIAFGRIHHDLGPISRSSGLRGRGYGIT
jgi:hypothetical protein